MEIPFSPQFFKKLEIYQRIKTFNKMTEQKTKWKHIKVILLWTIQNHQNLNSPLTRDGVKKILTGRHLPANEARNDIGNLIFYGFAVPIVTAIKHKRGNSKGKDEPIELDLQEKIIYKKDGKEIWEYWQEKKKNAGDIVIEQIEDIETIRFTKKGLEYAEVLSEMENKKTNFYGILSILIWLTIIIGVILLFKDFLFFIESIITNIFLFIIKGFC